MTKLLERMFGPRPQTSEASDIIVRTREAAAAALRESATFSAKLTAPDRDDEPLFAAYRRCADIHEQLLQTAVTLPDPIDPFRVVLMGRTQAGKSTLFNYLTGSERSLVGSGGQRTTRHVVPARLAGRSDILVVDTPGVGALDGTEDRAIALEAARTADLVVWVAANNALQEETAAAMEQLADWGVPLILVWNCRAALDTPEQRADFLQYPEDTFEGLSGHQNRAHSYLGRFGQRPRAELALHAGAALASFTDTSAHEALLQASGAGQLIRLLEAEADRRPHYRTLAIADVARRELVDSQRAAHSLADDLLFTHDTRVRAAEDLDKRAQELLKDADLRLEAGLAATLDKLRGWVDEHYHLEDDRLQEAWNHAEEKARAEIAQHFTDSGEQLNQDLARATDDVIAGWSARFDRLQALHKPRVPGLGTPWIDKAVRVAVVSAGAALTAVVSYYVPPAAMQVAGLVDSVVGRILGSLGGANRRLARRRTRLHRWVSEAREEMHKEAVADWRGDVAPVRAAIDTERIADLASAERARDTADFSRRLAEQAGKSISGIDALLVRALLCLAGCERVAAQVQNVVRRPGLAAAVLLTEHKALDELLLWPPHTSPEPIRPVPGQSASPAVRAAHALDLGRRGGVIVPTPDGLEAIVDDGSSEEILRAEGPLVSAAAGVAITLRNSSSTKDDPPCQG